MLERCAIVLVLVVGGAAPAAAEDGPGRAVAEESPAVAKKAGAAAGGSKDATLGLGVGIFVGDPFALSARFWILEFLAVQVLVGYTVHHSGFHASADVVAGIRDFIGNGLGVAFDLTGGVGMTLGTAAGPSGFHHHTEPWVFSHRNDDPSVLLASLRVPVTFSAGLSAVPLEIYVEAAPGYRFTPDGLFEFDGGAGARWLF